MAAPTILDFSTVTVLHVDRLLAQGGQPAVESFADFPRLNFRRKVFGENINFGTKKNLVCEGNDGRLGPNTLYDLLEPAGLPYLDPSRIFRTDAARLRWDAANHRLGINTAAPTADLDVAGTVRATTLDVTGATGLAGSLEVGGTSEFTGAVVMNSDLTVTGTITANGQTHLNAAVILGLNAFFSCDAGTPFIEWNVGGGPTKIEFPSGSAAPNLVDWDTGTPASTLAPTAWLSVQKNGVDGFIPWYAA